MVNRVLAKGGSIDGPGPAIAGGILVGELTLRLFQRDTGGTCCSRSGSIELGTSITGFHAIWHEKLYIHTTSDFHELVRERVDDIIGQRNPVLSPALMRALGIPSPSAQTKAVGAA